ncbi:MAG: rod shape-determining protein [Acutalibacteraceae bacterium]|jgi:rod shape-determining protein MreB
MGTVHSDFFAGLASLFSVFSRSVKDIAIDLGTANTLVYVRGRGIVLREPSVVAVDVRTDEVLAVGKQAKEMLGRTPDSIVAVRPLKDGVIADFEVTAAMLKYFVRKALRSGAFSRPHIVICIPSGVTEVERRAVEDAARSAGSGKVDLILEPMAAALGAGIAIDKPRGSMVLDIGGGTSEMAVISYGDPVVSESVRVAGDRFDEAIAAHLKKKYGVVVGERTAEQIKIRIGSAYPLEKLQSVSMSLRAASAADGQPRDITVTAEDVREALMLPLKSVFEALHSVLERTPPELAADLLETGIVLTGGGALLRGLDRFLHEATGLPVHIAEHPMDCVARGAGKTLEGRAYIPANARRAEEA